MVNILLGALSNCRTWRDGPDFQPWTQFVTSVQLEETLLLFGGTLRDDSVTDQVLMYDPQSGQFVTTDLKLKLARTRAAAVAVPSNYCQG